ncbi:MAG: hypothetical protein LBD46_07785, partial [Endomicrobium sp.]|nr:hypothetical protein [Endomicrobium sp.]
MNEKLYTVRLDNDIYEVAGPADLNENQILNIIQSNDIKPVRKLDAFQGFLNNMSEGLMYNMADIGAGATGSVRALKNALLSAKFNPKDINQDMHTAFINDRKKFNDVKNDFTLNYPKTALGAEILGSLIPLLLFKLSSTSNHLIFPDTIKQHVKSGAVFGGADAALRNWTDNENLMTWDSAKDFLNGLGLGSAGGALMSGFMPTAYVGFKKLFGKKDKFNKFIKHVGKENIDRSINEKKAILDFADENIMEMAEYSRLHNTKAKQIYKDYSKTRKTQQVDNINDLIDKNFGNKGSIEVLNQIQEDAKKVYEPIYKKAMNYGRIPYIKQTPYTQSLIKKIKKDPLFEDWARLPDDDIRILDLVKQKIDDDITKYTNYGEKLNVSQLMKEKEQLLNAVDSVVPEYAQARKAFADMKVLEEALERGRNFYKMSREEIKNFAQTLDPNQQKAFYTGIREKLVKDLDDGAKSKGVNVSRRVFDDSVLRKLEGLKIDNFENIKNRAIEERQAIENLNNLLGNSMTAQRQALKPSAFLNPKKLMNKTIDNTYQKFLSYGKDTTAKYLTSPKDLEQQVIESIKNASALSAAVNSINTYAIRPAGNKVFAASVTDDSYNLLPATLKQKVIESIKNASALNVAAIRPAGNLTSTPNSRQALTSTPNSRQALTSTPNSRQALTSTPNSRQ